MQLKLTIYHRIIFFVIFDSLIGVFTLYLAYLLRFNFTIPNEFLDKFWIVATAILSLRVLFFYIFKIYYRSWRFFGLKDLKDLIKATTLAYILFFVIFYIAPNIFNPMPRSAVIIDFFLSLMFISLFRISKRVFLESTNNISSKRAVVIGIDSHTPSAIKAAQGGDIPYQALCAVSKDSSLIGSYIESVKVYPLEDLERICKDFEINSALIAGSVSAKELDSIVERLASVNVNDIKRISLLSESAKKLQDIDIEDLLAREPKDLDIKVIKEFIKNKTILVTGAGGSIGSEICRQVVDFGCKKLIMVDNAEYNLYKINEELNSTNVVAKLLSILDIDILEEVFDEYKPDIVIHAAAYKHVPLCEDNAKEAIRNNIGGVVNIIDLSIKYGVKKVVNISSDKAVRPTNVMGATKRVGELYAQNVDSKDTEVVSVRFGNVLGSSGSVVPKFKAQIENGGPVTVTHPEITRYFMLIPEACRLVLQASAIAKGGELFILDMGEPVKIVDLAKKMIRLYGKEGQIEIIYTGLRKGEKLYEELLIDDAECKTKYDSIYVAGVTLYDIKKLKDDIKEALSSNEPKEILKKIVPEYKVYEDKEGR